MRCAGSPPNETGSPVCRDGNLRADYDFKKKPGTIEERGARRMR